MKEQVSQVMAKRVQSINLEVEHMRQPGHRVPVGSIRLSERPDHTFTGQSLVYMRVLGDITVVVKIKEPVVQHLRVDRKGGDYQK